uniref:PA2Cu1_2p n=1 Tax=uncultured organism TaxID=155900 RepID=K9LK72_9ZZZZ|nr:pA2Cu1_2p [uncultured organism]
MADYKGKLDEWQKTVRRKARELDEKYALSDLVGEGSRAAGEAAKRGAETVASGAEKLRLEAERLSSDGDVADTAKRAASEAVRGAEKAGKVIMDAAGDVGKQAGKTAGDVFDEAKTYYDRASHFYDTSAKVTRASSAATASVLKAREWIKENPGKAALVSFSLVVGVRMGTALPGLDAVLLGAHPHWLTHSALPIFGARKLSEKFNDYIRKQEQLMAEGQLDEAERKRVEFARNMTKYVGAPLLGTLSCAAGAVMFAQILQPGSVVGAPVSWIVGGNPFLGSVWLFANGVICFHEGYKFFMIALADQDEVNRVVREIKGLLPAAATA